MDSSSPVVAAMAATEAMTPMRSNSESQRAPPLWLVRATALIAASLHTAMRIIEQLFKEPRVAPSSRTESIFWAPLSGCSDWLGDCCNVHLNARNDHRAARWPRTSAAKGARSPMTAAIAKARPSCWTNR
eukprot:scaffold269916_cov32-Tisochrysis_lutea.AAC.1